MDTWDPNSAVARDCISDTATTFITYRLSTTTTTTGTDLKTSFGTNAVHNNFMT